MKATAIAPSNIAFIKYWGRKDEKLKIPTNDSISMNLSGLITTTTVVFQDDLTTDTVVINNMPANEKAFVKVATHLDRIRNIAKKHTKAKVVSQNSFPSDTGLSSSASGFAALTLAASRAVGLKLSEKELSSLARLGSGSACRSIPDGFVQWHSGNKTDNSFASSLYSQAYWDIVDLVVVLSTEKKVTGTTKAQEYAATSPFFIPRLEGIETKIKKFKNALQKKDFTLFGNIIEQEALELHAIMLTQNPWFCYFAPQTIQLIAQIKAWREEGMEIYFTINTGANVHILCTKNNAKKIQKIVKALPYVQEVIYNTASKGARESSTHLF